MNTKIEVTVKELMEMQAKMHEKKEKIQAKLYEKEKEMQAKVYEKMEMQAKLYKKEKEMQAKLYEKEREMQAKVYEKEMEMQANVHEKKLEIIHLQNAKDNLQKELANINLKYIKEKKAMTPKSIMNYIECQKVIGDCSESLGRSKMWLKYLEKPEVEAEFSQDFCDKKEIATTAEELYNNKSKFIIFLYLHSQKVTMSECFLTSNEWKLMALIWKLIPLPKDILFKVKSDGVEEIVA